MNDKRKTATKSSDKKSKEFEYYYGGDNAYIGFNMVPRTIFDKQSELGLSDGELNVFLHFLNGLSKSRLKQPYCYQTLQSPRFLANKTGKSQRQISRAIAGLKEKGFIEAMKEYRAAGGAMIRSHNIEPGIKKIKTLAKHLRDERKEKDMSIDSLSPEELLVYEDEGN